MLATQAVFLSLTHSFVAVLQDQGEHAGEILARLRSKIDEPIAAILTLNTVAHTAGAAFGGALALEVFGSKWVALFSAVLTLAILILSEIIPKTIGATYWQRLARPCAYVLLWMTRLMKPVLVPLHWMARLFTPGARKGVTISRAEFEVLAEIGLREGEIEEDEWLAVHSVLNLDKVTVAEIMTPRPDVVAIPEEATVLEARQAMLDSGFLRLPVYSGSKDNITGILLARDVWKAEGLGVTGLADLTRPALHVPQSHVVEDLIRRMRNDKVQMAIVLDEYGGTSGIVTLEDLLEEIVGEIQDEHELEPISIMKTPEGGAVIRGEVPLRVVNRQLNLALSDEEYDTIGGYVFGALGHLPEAGEELSVERGRIIVKAMQGRRVEAVHFVPDRPQPASNV